jgi:hypothetical protein
LPQLLLVQQRLTHLLDIDGFILEQLNQTFSRIDPSEIILGQGATRFANTSSPLSDRSTARRWIAIPFPWHHRWNGLQPIDIETPGLFQELVDVRLIPATRSTF